MPQSPKVSVIIPAYNAARYVREAVDSALAQKYGNIEVIVIDDGSTDETKNILESYIREGKIKYVYQQNKGLAGTRNAGIKNSTGEYVAFLDADDIFLPDKIESVAHFFEAHKECCACYHDSYHFQEDKPGELLKFANKYYSGEDILPNLIRGYYFLAPSTMTFRRSVFERQGYFNETFRRSEDLEFIVRITSRGAQICFLPKILGKICLRRCGNLQDFKSQSLMKETTLKIYEKLYADLNEEGRRRYRLRYFLGIHRLRLAATYLGVADKQRARPYILKSFSDYPLGPLFGSFLWFLVLIIPAAIMRSFIVKLHSLRRKFMYTELKNTGL